MKNQIKALDTAKDNCEDGANLIQTAEGGIGEIHDILTRMTELAEKAANGVLEDTDRDKLQKEMDQLSGEIDRIATTSNFNGQKLLDGSLGSNGYVKINQSVVTKEQTSYAKAGMKTHGKATTVTTEFTTKGVALSFAKTKPGDIVKDTAAEGSSAGIKLQIGETSTLADKLEVKINSFHTDSLFAGIAGYRNKSVDGSDKADNDAVGKIRANSMDYGDGGKVSTYKQAVSIDISDQDSASAAADAIRQVANYVSEERGKLGAQQNRLEHTVNNLTTASENTTAAKSRILDTDMAKEMMEYTSKNVIAQAAQSMLAQANSQPQNVLSLLQ
jgi:flagellin